MPRAFPEEFRRDVVAVARRREAPQKQIAEDFGISHATLSSWLRQADIEDGNPTVDTLTGLATTMGRRVVIVPLEGSLA